MYRQAAVPASPGWSSCAGRESSAWTLRDCSALVKSLLGACPEDRGNTTLPTKTRGRDLVCWMDSLFTMLLMMLSTIALLASKSSGSAQKAGT